MDPLAAFAAIATTTNTTQSTFPATRDEAMVCWTRALKESTGDTLKLEKTRITSAAAIQALYEVLPSYPQIKKLDFSLCTFSNDAFTALMAPPESPRYELELAWIPADQLYFFDAQKIARFAKLTIHPPTDSFKANEIELFIQRVQAIYADIMGSFHLNLSLCQFSKAQTGTLEDLVPRGLQLEIELPVHLPSLIVPVDISGEKLPQPNEPIPETFEILQDQKATPAKCTANWRNLLGTLEEGVTDFNLNDSEYTIFSKAPNPISTFFKEIQKSKHQVDSFDLCGIIFSEETWEALLQSLNNYKPAIKKLTFNSISLDQLESLFTKLSTETLLNLEELDLSQSLATRITPEDKVRLSKLLSEHLPKLKLKELHLNDWLLEDQHLNFATTETEIHIKNHRIKNNSNQKVHLIANKTESSNTTALFANSEIDEATLETLWGITLPESIPPLVALGDPNGPDLFIDSPTSIQTFFNELKKNSQYRILHFLRLEFSEQAWTTLLKNLQNNPSITGIGFNRCHLSPTRITQLGSIPHLQKLAIYSNGELTKKAEFFRSLQQIISQSPNLRTLDLSCNHLTDGDLPSIFSFGVRRQLTHLVLRGNCLTDEGLNYLNEWKKVPSSGQKRNSNGEPATPCKINLERNPIPSLVLSEVDPAEEAFETNLRKFFTIENVLDDGNCLFHACALEVTASHQELRKRAVDHMKKNEGVFELYMEDNTTLKDYTNWMSQDTAWGGDVEIAALSQSLDVPIAVYSKELPPKERDGKLFPHDNCVFGAEEGKSIFDNPNTIFLYRCDEKHFQRLYPKQA